MSGAKRGGYKKCLRLSVKGLIKLEKILKNRRMKSIFRWRGILKLPIIHRRKNRMDSLKMPNENS